MKHPSDFAICISSYRFVFTMKPQEGNSAPLMAQIRSYRLQ